MTNLEMLAVAAAIVVVGYCGVVVARGGEKAVSWLLPAIVSAAFLGYSMIAIVTEGPTGFWPVHTQSYWGVQVWMDLLFAVAMTFTLLMPRAKKLGMNGYAWLAVILCTGCIGGLVMYSRIQYLESKGNLKH